MSPSPIQPSLFVPHGAPTFALRPGAAGAALVQAASHLVRPRAVIVVSPHWDSETPLVGAAHKPETIHDYWGFPQELYSIRYPASGCVEASKAVAQALRDAGFVVALDESRGLDHGAWIPLRLMFPDADVPVIPLSIQPQRDPAYHYALGKALAPLAAKGILTIGTGSLTHNLGDFQRAVGQAAPMPRYVREFPDWIWDRIQARDLPALLNYRQIAPEAVRAHPRDEHLLPLFVALGAAAENCWPQRLHAGVDDFVIAMDAYAFYPERTS